MTGFLMQNKKYIIRSYDVINLIQLELDNKSIALYARLSISNKYFLYKIRIAEKNIL